MAIKMKGLLKGLRYISHIFEAEVKEEQELQIGAPTNVKHVAHIGWDGPTSNAPSWMSQYKSEGDLAGVVKVDQEYTLKTHELKLLHTEKRASTEYESTLESPSKRRSSKPRTARKQMTSGSSIGESPRRLTRLKKSAPSNDSPGPECDLVSSSTKGTRRKKSSKTSSKVKGTSSQLEDGLRGAQAEPTAAC